MGNETVSTRKKNLRNSFSVDFGHQKTDKIRTSNVFKLSPINETKQRSELQIPGDESPNEMSVQKSSIMRINEQMRKQSGIRLRKLASTNDQLRKQLIRISSELTQKLKKKKFQVKKVEQKETNPNKKQSLKKQLQNAYKQIDMYKRVLSDLKVGSQSSIKLVYVQDKISSVDIQIQNTLRQMEAIKNVNNNQAIGIKNNKEKEFSVIQQLKSEIQILKIQIKQKSKQQRLKQKKYMQQHYYMKALQNKVKQMNQQEDQDPDAKQVGNKKASQQQIKEAQKQLQYLKLKHDDYHKKINNYISNNKMLKQEKNQLKNSLEEKKKIVQGLKYKRDALVKQIKDNLHLLASTAEIKQDQLSQFQSDQQEQPSPIQEQEQERGTFDIDHLKDHNLKLIPKQQMLKKKQSQLAYIQQETYRAEPKLWKKRLTRIISKGKQMSDEKHFSTGLNTIPKVDIKIVQMNIWMNKKKQITAIQPSYLIDGRIFEGNKSSKNIEDQYRVTFQLQEHDFLKSILGIFGKSGFLQYLVLQSNFGKISKIGREQTDGDNFAIGVAKQQTPVQITGANRQDGLYWRISRLDFEVLIQN